VLRQYRQHIKDKDSIILKVPQIVFAQKLRRGTEYIPNDVYLDPEIFTEQFYKPALEVLGKSLTGFIFEQEYQRSKDRLPEDQGGNAPLIAQAIAEKFLHQVPQCPIHPMEKG